MVLRRDLDVDIPFAGKTACGHLTLIHDGNRPGRSPVFES
jgi:hypothetical protein